jgi:inosine-uridine nucleoside N-ribohydrolase
MNVTDGKDNAQYPFQPSYRPAHIEILELLAKNPEDTIDIVAVGPLSTIAQAAAADPLTFLRARRLVVMGGALREPGNMTPLAEFNFYADPLAAARVLALTSPTPTSTMPRPDISGLAAYPSSSQLGSKRLKVVLFPLDTTHQHCTAKADYIKVTDPLVKAGSPLAEWLSHLFLAAVAKVASLNYETELTLHDPLCVWYALREPQESELWSVDQAQDIRVEVSGQWARGACIIDRRDRRKMDEVGFDEYNLADRVGDDGGWLSHRRGNRVGVCVRTPGSKAFTNTFLSIIFGSPIT